MDEILLACFFVLKSISEEVYREFGYEHKSLLAGVKRKPGAVQSLRDHGDS